MDGDTGFCMDVLSNAAMKGTIYENVMKCCGGENTQKNSTSTFQPAGFRPKFVIGLLKTVCQIQGIKIQTIECHESNLFKPFHGLKYGSNTSLKEFTRRATNKRKSICFEQPTSNRIYLGLTDQKWATLILL